WPEQKEKPVVASRINRAIELLSQDQAIYYVGAHSGHVLTRAQGREDAKIWADYINIGMEHGAFDMTGLGEYMQGLVEGGPTRSGHRAPTVRSEEHTSELQSLTNLVCRLLLEKKKT